MQIEAGAARALQRVLGRHGLGKTNLLEAIFVIASLRSFAREVSALVAFGQERC